MNQKLAGFLSVFVGSISIATLGVFAKFGYIYGGTPLTLLFIRFLSGAVMFWIVVMFLKYKIDKISLKDLIILFSGSCFIVFSSVTYFYALKYIEIPLAISIVYLYPAFVTLFAFLFFKEKISRVKVIALILSLCGGSLLIKIFNIGNAGIHLIGIILAMMCSILVASYIVVIQRTLSRYRIFSTAVLFITFAAIIAFFIMLPRWQTLGTINGNVLITGILMAFFTIFLPRIFLFYGIKKIGASRMSIICSSELIFSSLFAFLLLGEGFDIIQGAGAFLILSGTIIVNFD